MTELKQEEWKDVPGYEGYYQVSDIGRVRSLDRKVIDKANYRSVARAREFKGGIMNPYTTKSGYKMSGLYISNIQRHIFVHRLVALAFIPNPENKPQVNHIDGDKLNNNVWNLEWATSKENTIHAVNNNLINTGQDHHLAKLSNNDVIEIKKMVSNGMMQKDIAKIFNVDQSHISRIYSGQKRYKK